MKSKVCHLAAAVVLLSLAPAVASAQGSLFDTYLDAATKAIKEKHYDAAEVFAEASVQEAQQRNAKGLQGTEPRLVVSLHVLAQIYFDRGKKDKIKDLFGDRKLRIDVKDLGPELLPLASQLYTLGNTYYDLGREARKKSDSIIGKDDPNKKALDEQANLKLELAKRMFLICSTIRKRNLEPGNLDEASSLSLLGLVHYTMNESSDASSRFEEAVKGREVRTATVVGLTENGYRYSVSKPSRDISISQEVETLDVTIARIYMARDLIYNYDEQKDKKKDDKANRLLRAERELKRTVEEWKEWPEHENVAMSLNNLGLLYNSQQRYDDAEPMYKRSLAILEKIKAPNDGSVVAVRKNYAEVLRKKAELSRKAGRETEAKEYDERAKKLSNE